ncbi:MAG TPA: metallophosphoesterase [Gaiellaceae bacterium]|nr:metallophosphoesterase [Gaiellaceae bacterium]
MPNLRLLHVSDLHAGTKEEPEVEDGLRALVRATEPGLVIATGDLTHRNRPADHARAATLLRSLERPLVVVPGNHDIPPWSPARFTRTFAAFQHEWPELEPVHRSAGIVVCGLNSVTPWKHQGGTLRRSQLDHAARVLAEAPPGALRVVALHHHLIGAPWRSVKRPVARRGEVLGALVEAGAELILSGHVHQSAVGERREFEVAEGPVPGTTVVTAPGLGQPRPRRRGEARGLHLIEADEGTLRVLTHAWAGGGWGLIADRRFARGPEPLGAIGRAAREREAASGS